MKFCLKCGDWTARNSEGKCVLCRRQKACSDRRSGKTQTADRIRSRSRRQDPAYKAWARKYAREYQRKKLFPQPTRKEPEVCELCREKSDRALNLDHDHATHTFRGWLCWRCNSTLGKLGDSLATVQDWSAKAIEYLRRAA